MDNDQMTRTKFTVFAPQFYSGLAGLVFGLTMSYAYLGIRPDDLFLRLLESSGYCLVFAGLLYLWYRFWSRKERLAMNQNR